MDVWRAIQKVGTWDRHSVKQTFSIKEKNCICHQQLYCWPSHWETWIVWIGFLATKYYISHAAFKPRYHSGFESFAHWQFENSSLPWKKHRFPNFQFFLSCSYREKHGMLSPTQPSLTASGNHGCKENNEWRWWPVWRFTWRWSWKRRWTDSWSRSHNIERKVWWSNWNWLSVKDYIDYFSYFSRLFLIANRKGSERENLLFLFSCLILIAKYFRQANSYPVLNFIYDILLMNLKSILNDTPFLTFSVPVTCSASSAVNLMIE